MKSGDYIDSREHDGHCLLVSIWQKFAGVDGLRVPGGLPDVCQHAPQAGSEFGACQPLTGFWRSCGCGVIML